MPCDRYPSSLETRIRMDLTEHNRLLTEQSKFRPRWWLRNPHVQTIYASKLANVPNIDTLRERLELADGDFLDLNWSKKTAGPIICLFHGLAGCVDSAYARRAIYALETNGYRPVFMHHRGCSGEPNRLAKSYHSGHTEDITTMIATVRQRYPAERVGAVGYSLGANALLKYLGERGKNSALDAAVAVCPPLVLSTCADTINTGFARLYQRYLLALMHKQYVAKQRAYPELNLADLPRGLTNFWRFDDAVTAPLHGFKNVHDYYDQCSGRAFVPDIKTPTHILYALNDPFFSPSVLPTADELPDCVQLHTPQHGGHVGFLEHPAPAKYMHWLDRRTVEWLKPLLSAQ